MSAAVAAIAGGSLLGASALSAKGASEAAGAQSDAAQQAIALKREIFEKQQELLAPYVQLGTDVGLPGLQRLSTPEGQADYYRNYYQSPQFAAQADTARNQQLAASEATGGLQSTSTANQLARISPTLGLAALQNQQGLYGQLTNIGLSGAGSTAGYAGQYGSGASNLLQAQGAAQAQAAAAPYAALSSGISQLGGLGVGYKLGLFGGK